MLFTSRVLPPYRDALVAKINQRHERRRRAIASRFRAQLRDAFSLRRNKRARQLDSVKLVRGKFFGARAMVVRRAAKGVAVIDRHDKPTITAMNPGKMQVSRIPCRILVLAAITKLNKTSVARAVKASALAS